jgi:hypothetical protein
MPVKMSARKARYVGTNTRANGRTKLMARQAKWMAKMPSTRTSTALAGLVSVFVEMSIILNAFYFIFLIWDGKEYNEFEKTIYDQIPIESMQQFMEGAMTLVRKVQNGHLSEKCKMGHLSEKCKMGHLSEKCKM